MELIHRCIAASQRSRDGWSGESAKDVDKTLRQMRENPSNQRNAHGRGRGARRLTHAGHLDVMAARDDMGLAGGVGDARQPRS